MNFLFKTSASELINYSTNQLINYLAPRTKLSQLNKLLLLKIIGLLAAVTLVIASFLPWVVIESRDIVITGVDSGGTKFGKPAYFHFVLIGLFVICSLVQKVGVKRVNLMVTALNLGWAVRNYFLISACAGGECPEKKIGLILVLVSSIMMLVSALFPDRKIKTTAN